MKRNQQLNSILIEQTVESKTPNTTSISSSESETNPGIIQMFSQMLEPIAQSVDSILKKLDSPPPPKRTRSFIRNPKKRVLTSDEMTLEFNMKEKEELEKKTQSP
jgi:hypothetical protein